MSEPLATVGDLKTFLGAPDDFDETVAALYLDIASGEARAATGRTFDLVEDDEILVSGDRSTILYLPDPPVLDVASLIEAPGSDAELDLGSPTGSSAAWEWSRSGVIRRLDGYNFARRFRYYAVVYDHGFAEIPRAVSGVVLRMAARVISNPEGIKQEAIGRFSYTRAGESAGVGLLPADRVALAAYILDRPGRTE